MTASTLRFVEEERLEPGRVFDGHVSAQGKDDRVRCHAAMDSHAYRRRARRGPTL